MQAVLLGFGLDAEAAANSFFPSAQQYRGLLEESGFAVRTIDLIARPTLLAGGKEGMAVWLNVFRNDVLDLLAPAERQLAVTRTVALLRPILADVDGEWTADYVRLRFYVTRRKDFF